MAASDSALTCLQIGDHDLLSQDHLNQEARALGHAFRDSTLTPGRTLVLYIRQIAHGNVACAAMGHLAKGDFTDMAWCLARQRLPVESIRQLNRRVVARIAQCSDSTDALWRLQRLPGGRPIWIAGRLVCTGLFRAVTRKSSHDPHFRIKNASFDACN